MIHKVVTFGEIMLRLTPPGFERLIQAKSLNMAYGGAEANVAVSLAQFGVDVSYVTKLPNNFLGDAVIEELRGYGVDTKYIVRGGDRLGIYYLERGASVRSSKVLYDRANSAIADAYIDDFDWEKIFMGADWFHFTGITPALGDNIMELAIEACKKAKDLGMAISCDINFRSSLWDAKTAGTKIGTLLNYVDICIANEEHIEMLFGIQAPGKEKDRDAFDKESAIYVSKAMLEKFHIKKMAITYRRTISANENKWWASIYAGENIYISEQYHIDIIDRIGSGDAFTGGLIYGLISKDDPQFAVEFGAGCCAFKHTIEGDFNHVHREEILDFIYQGKKGQIKR